MAEMNVLAANALPKIKRPRKNNNHVSTVIIISTVINSAGMTVSITIASPDIPPVIRPNGNIKTAVPNAKTKVPITTQIILRF